MKTVRLENWGTMIHYCCPKHGTGPALGGEIYGDPDVPDGTRRITGYIDEIDVEGRRARSGETWFLLGQIDPPCLEMMRAGAPPVSGPDPTITNETAVAAMVKKLEMGRKFFGAPKPKIDPSLN